MVREVRFERLLAAEVRSAMAEAPVAWVPLGALEFHAEHLPYGTDGFTAQQVVERAARRAGGVVLPWSALTIGTLRLDWTFRYDSEVVAATLRQTLLQVAQHGASVAVVLTGHGPLDLAHLIKRVCAEVEESPHVKPDFRAYGLCYLELNAALGAGLGTDWPVAIDHGSIVETSWLMAMEPDLVDLDRLPEDPEASDIVGVYGPNPRSRATAAMGREQIDACAGLLAERVGKLLDGERVDPMADLRVFVERYWPEPMLLGGRAGSAREAAILLTNPAPVSRYLTSVDVVIDAERLERSATGLINRTAGESGVLVAADALGPEAGFYVRRQQTAEILLPQAVSPGRRSVSIEVGLAGVTTTTLSADVSFE